MYELKLTVSKKGYNKDAQSLADLGYRFNSEGRLVTIDTGKQNEQLLLFISCADDLLTPDLRRPIRFYRRNTLHVTRSTRTQGTCIKTPTKLNQVVHPRQDENRI
jgi:hypothetical protein